MRAAYHDCSQVVELLLDEGADSNAQSESGETALMRAAMKGHIATVKVLLARGARLDIQSKQGDTALSVSRFGSQETAQFLADVYAKH